MAGRKRIKLDPDQIEKMAAIGATNADIADILNVSCDTIERRYSDALKRGRANRRLDLLGMQWRSAVNGSIAMQIWLGKQILGQREVPIETAIISLPKLDVELIDNIPPNPTKDDVL